MQKDNKILEAAIVFALLAGPVSVMLYGAFAIGAATLNVGKWDDMARVMFAFCLVTCWIGALAVTFEAWRKVVLRDE